MHFSSHEIGLLIATVGLLVATGVIWTIIHGDNNNWIIAPIIFTAISLAFFVGDDFMRVLHGTTLWILFAFSLLVFVLEVLADLCWKFPMTSRRECEVYHLAALAYRAVRLARDIQEAFDPRKPSFDLTIEIPEIPVQLQQNFMDTLTFELGLIQLSYFTKRRFENEFEITVERSIISAKGRPTDD